MTDRRSTSGTVTRRDFVRGAGAAGLAIAATPALWFQPGTAAELPEQLHLQFGNDPSTEMVVSWATSGSVRRPRVRLGTPDGGFGREIAAETRTYVDAQSGVDPAGQATLRPRVVTDRLDVVDTSRGLVQMIIGGGGTSAPSNKLFYDPPRCDVIMSVGPQLPTPPGQPRPKRVPNKVTEDAPWVGTRDRDHAYGFAAFDVDPGEEGGLTTIDVTMCDTAPSTTGVATVFERFRLERPRRHPERREEQTGVRTGRSPAVV